MIALLIRDLRLSVRSGGGFGQALAFFLMVVVFVPFGVGPETALLSRIAVGILWIGALLASLLTLDRMFQHDWDDGSLDAMATGSMPLQGIVAVKATAHWLTTGLPLTLAAPILGVLLGMDASAWPWLCAALLLGTPAFSLLGAFSAALTVGVRRGGLLLSLVAMPFYVPTLIFGAETALRGASGLDIGVAPYLLAGVTCLAAALAPIAGAAALRINLK